MNALINHRDRIRDHHRADETETLNCLIAEYAPSDEMRVRIRERAIQVVKEVRSKSGPTLTESFLGE